MFSRLQSPHLRGVAILCALCTAAVLLLHERFVPYQQFELDMRDLVTRFFTQRATADPRLVYIALDDATMNVGGILFPDDLAASPVLQKMAAGWPWPRDVHAMLIQRLLDAGAKVVALDILFPSPRDGDAELKAVLDRYPGRVVIGSNFADAETTGAARSLTQPSPDLIANGRTDDRVGFVNFWPDVDGIVRTAVFRETQHEAFGTAENGDVYYSLAARVLQKLGINVPDGRRGLRFVPADVAQGGFNPIPLYMIFLPKAWKDNFGSGAAFKDKIVIVGPYGNSLKDQLPTPLGLMDGPELHLNAINNALSGNFVTVPTELETTLLIVGLGFAAFIAACLLNRPVVLAGALAGVTLAYLGITALMQNHLGRILPFFSPLLVFDGSSVLALYWKWLLERQERARMRRMFERFVSKNVVKEVVENRSSFLNQIGGVRKSVAVLMTDLRGFTTLTEEADSVQLVAQLNEYFTEMVKCVFAANGTLDKFVGDAILAVWGNVHSGGDESDAQMSVITALRMIKALRELNADWMERGWPVFKMGVGINFGEVIFGVIGSEEKAEPTVIGDVVNTASRLEGLTKEYGVDLIIGESMAELVRPKFHLQLVDFVRVKGRMRPLKVYTVLGPVAEPLEPAISDYLSKYEMGLARYTAGDFSAACALFSEALEKKPGDSLATVYLERCRELAGSQPAEWDGVFVMHSK